MYVTTDDQGVRVLTPSGEALGLPYESDTEKARACFLALQALLGTAGNAVHDELCVDVEALGHVGVLAAVAATRGVRKATFRCRSGAHGGDTARAVGLMAVALFSGLACHAIEHVVMEIESRDQFRQLRDCMIGSDQDPLLDVVDSRYAPSVRANEHARATASRFALVDPTGDEDSATVVETGEYTALRVIDHQGSWWSVLLPAWGQAWVHDADIVVSTTHLVNGWRMGNRHIRTIEIASVAAPIADFEPLLLTMNPDVEELRLRVFDQRAPRDAWLRAVSSLRSLRELSFELVQRDQLESIVDALGSDSFLSSLEKLHLEVVCRSVSPVELASVLCDPSHRVYQCLESLVVRVVGPDDPRSVQALATDYAEVLHKNKRLVSFQFLISQSYDMQTYAAVERSLMVHDGIPLNIEPQPLALREKLAFVSAVQPSSSPCTLSDAVTDRLDPEVMMTIMQFAGSWRCRTVRVQNHSGVI